MPPSEPIREKPTCVAIVICNEIIEDKRTNNKTLVSLFNHILVPQFPVKHPRMYVMASFTDGRGNWPITFRITAPSGQTLINVPGSAEINDPLAVVDIVIEVRELPLEQEGVYDIDFLFDGMLVAHRHFHVRRAEEGMPG